MAILLISMAVSLIGVPSGVAAVPASTLPTHLPVDGAAAVAAAQASVRSGHGPASELSAFRAISQPASSPSAGNGLSMAYDAGDGYVLVVAPNVVGTGNNATWASVVQTWSFVGGNWSRLNPSASPPNRFSASAAYDSVDGYVLLFGGFGVSPSGPSGYLSDTWTYSGGNWTNLTGSLTTAPGPRESAPMVWDGTDNYCLLVAGFGRSGNFTGNLSEVWSYVNATWTKVGSAPGLRPEGSMAYDGADGYVIYFGGTYPSNLTNATWEYRTGTWTSITAMVHGAPAPRAGSSMAYDPALGGVLLFGGLGQTTNGYYWPYYNDTWLYKALNWTLLSNASGPAPRESANLAYDAADNVTILFGGYNYSSGSYSDTWAFNGSANGSQSNGTGWMQAAPHLEPTRASDDVGIPVTLTAGGIQGSDASFHYAGLPLGCSSADTPTLTCVPSRAGSYTVSVTANSSTGSATAATLLQVVPAPTIATFGVDPSLTEVGGSVTFSVTVGFGTAPFSLQFTGLPRGCGNSTAATFTCTVATSGQYTVAVNATDSLGATAQGWAELQVNPRLSVDMVQTSPQLMDVGQMVTIAPVALGGVGPFSFRYGPLPEGCASKNASAVECVPLRAGDYSVNATVEDALGFMASGTAELSVNTQPTIGAFSASNQTPTVNDSITLSVTMSGGTLPYAYAYTGLPGGCASVDLPILNCIVAASGIVTIQVAVTDAVGVTVNGSLSIDVAPAPITSSPGGQNGGTGSGGAPNGRATTFYFGIGLALGLPGLVAGVGVLMWRARIHREGQELVHRLRSERGRPGTPGPTVARQSGDPGGSEPTGGGEVGGQRGGP